MFNKEKGHSIGITFRPITRETQRALMALEWSHSPPTSEGGWEAGTY